MAIRISGLASGFDIESIIKEAMRGEQARVDAVRQQKQILEWKREQYREANTKFLALRSSLLNLKLQGTFMAKTVTSSDPAVLSATASSSAVGPTRNTTGTSRPRAARWRHSAARTCRTFSTAA